MDEKEPKVEVIVGFKFRIKDIPLVIGHLASMSVGDVRFGQGELDFVEEMEREALRHTVSVRSALRFYDVHYQDERPSPKAMVVMNRMGEAAPDEEKVVDEKGELVSVSRSFWDSEMAKIRRGESEINWRPGTKTRDFADKFDEFLPPAESAKKQKRKPS